MEMDLADELLQNLYRIFMVFCVKTETGRELITLEQAHFIINYLLRCSRSSQTHRLTSALTRSETVSLRDLIDLCQSLYPDRKELEPIVNRCCERYVSHLIAEGFLMCKGASKSSWCLPKSSHKWETYWCAIYPGFIYLWPGHKPKTLTNRIALKLNQSMSVQSHKEGERFIWQLSCTKYVFAEYDQLRSEQWMSDMKLAIQYQTKEDLKRYDQKCSKKSEKLIATEKNLTWRLALESENARLMQLLDDERRALHDEETVRALATRMLDEERDRREQLEERVRVLENMVNEQSSQRRETISSMDNSLQDAAESMQSSNDSAYLNGYANDAFANGYKRKSA